jgi:hypothetical protein
MKPFPKLLILVLCSFYFSCNQEQQDHQEVMAQVDLMQIPPPKEQEMLVEPQVLTERKIIREGTISFETNDAAETSQRIAKAVADYKGYITEDIITDQSYQIEHRVTIRIPAAKFDTLLATIAQGVDALKTKNVTSKDVTEEYVDVESRIKTKKELEARYQQLLQKATKVEEMLAIEREMGTLRTDIESIEGRLRYLKDRVAFSTLTIIYYETPAASFGFLGKLGVALGDGWNNLLEFLVAVVSVWPLWLLIAGFTLLLLRYRRRKAVKA